MQRKAATRWLRRLSLLGLGGTFLVLAASWYVAGQLIAPVRRPVGDPPESLQASAIELQSESGSTVHGWHTVSEQQRGCIVLLHGIRQTRRSMLSRAELLDSLGYSTISIDLQGHGESAGEAITLGHLESFDVAATVAHAKRLHPGEPIGVVGVSLGGAAALLASPLDIDALVLESVYSTIDKAVYNRVSDRLGPLATLPTQLLLVQLRPRLGITTAQLRPIDRMPNVDCPVFVISGEDDRHTTEAEARDMYEAARDPKELWIVPDAAHVDLLAKVPQAYCDQVAQFLAQHLHFD